MARSSSRGDLFITVGGDVTPLRSAMKAGKSVLNEFGLGAIDVQKEVDAALAKMGANAPAQAKKLEQAFAATFAEIRRNAQAVLAEPANDRAVGILNAAGARDAAAAAEAEAAALRQVADAAARADAAAGGTNAGVRLLAVSSETAAIQAEQHATALKGQVAALEAVQTELRSAAGASEAYDASQANVAKGSGNARIAQMELLHSVRASVDMYAFGTPIAKIFALQVAQVGQAAALAGDGLGKVGKFLGGPWGVVLIAATSLLASFASEHGNAAKKAKEHGDEEAVLTAYVNGETVANGALLESLVKLNEQESKSIQLKDQQIRKTIELTEQTLKQAQAQRALLATQLAQAKGDLEAAQAAQGRAASGGKGAIEAATGDTARQQGEVDRLQTSLSEVDQIIGQATARISTNIVRLARDLSTNVGRANDDFDKQQAAIEAKYRGKEVQRNGQTVLVGGALNTPGLSNQRREQLLAELTRKEEGLNASRAKAVAAATKLDNAEQGVTRSTERANREIGKQISFAEAASIARGAGLTVTSAQRSTAKQAELYRTVRTPENPVAKPGTSAHEGAHGKWALDIAFAPGLNPAKLRKLYGDQGVTLSAIYKESGHYHIEGSRSQAAAAENAAARAENKGVSQDDNFASQMQRLDEQLLQARVSLVGDTDAQARFASDQVEADRKAYELSVQKAVDAGNLREAQGKELIERNNAVAAQRQATAAVQAFIQKEDDLQKAIDQDADLRLQDLRYRYDIAKSSKERRDLALEILDLEYQQKKSDLEIARAKAVEAQKWNEVGLIDQQIADLPNQESRDRANANRQNRSPLGDYFDKLPHSLDEVKDRLEEIEVTGLNKLEDDLASATTKALGLKGALGDVVGMLLKLAFEAAISAAFPKGFGGARAGGGGVNPSSWYVVGEKGPEIFVPSSSGTIIPNSMLSASPPRAVSLAAANSNAPQRSVLEVRLKDEMLEARISGGAQVELARAYPGMKADILGANTEANRRRA